MLKMQVLVWVVVGMVAPFLMTSRVSAEELERVGAVMTNNHLKEVAKGNAPSVNRVSRVAVNDTSKVVKKSVSRSEAAQAAHFKKAPSHSAVANKQESRKKIAKR